MIDQNLIEEAKRKWANACERILGKKPGFEAASAFDYGLQEGIRLANEAAQPIISNLEMMLSGAKEEELE